MMLDVMYNENDPFAAEWCRGLVAAKKVPRGRVDQRSIVELQGKDCGDSTHFFAGILGWPVALEFAGWPEDVPVFSGSAPCQPFSDAGKRKGQADKRHLWPEMLRLIKERKALPPAVFGEQTESKLAREWLAGVRADLEGLGYWFGAADLPSCGVGAPHIRQRFFWGAILDSDGLAARLGRTETWVPRGPLTEALRRTQRSIELHDGFRLDASGGLSDAEDANRGSRVSDEQETPGKRRDRSTEHRGAHRGIADGMVDASGTRAATEEQQRQLRSRVPAGKRLPESFRVGDAVQQRLEGLRRHVDDRSEPRWFFAYPDGSAPAAGLWNDFRLVRCRDGKIRRVGSGVARGVVDGISGRVGKLRGFGNAINPALAAVFVRSFVEAWIESR